MPLVGFGIRTLLYEDSRAVIAMSENPVNRKTSRHIDTKHFIGQLVEDKTIVLEQCVSDRMVEDTQTKGLPDPAFENHNSEMLGKTSNTCSVCVAFRYKGEREKTYVFFTPMEPRDSILLRIQRFTKVNSQDLYKPRVPERNYLQIGYRGDVGVTKTQN